MEKNILVRLQRDYERFTPAEKKITDYVLAHRQETQYLSITDLGRRCRVAVATISVFCRKLQLSGFQDFKLELARAGSVALSAPDEELLGPCMDALRMTHRLLTPQALEQAAELLHEARCVVCLGQGNNSAIAAIAWARLSTVSPKFKTAQDSHHQTISISTLDRRDAVLYFSYSGATHEVMDAAHAARELGFHLVLITRFGNAPATEFADVVLLCGPDEEPLRFGSGAATMCQMYVLERLVQAFCRRIPEEAERYRAIVGKSLAKKQL